MIQISKEEKMAIQSGNVDALAEILKALDARIVKSLKKDAVDTRFYQGASAVTDALLTILK